MKWGVEAITFRTKYDFIQQLVSSGGMGLQACSDEHLI
jgi:hypothetical protein